MSNFHDPNLIVRQLRQILVTGKLPIGFFVGAGCPTAIRVPNEAGVAEPLIPDVAGLTSYVLDDLSHDVAIAGVAKRLLAMLEADGEAKPNIERILTWTRSLHDVAGHGEVRGMTHLELAALDRSVCKSITKRVRRKLPEDSAYHSLARFSGANRSSPVTVFTTNYDLLMEQAFERLRVPFFDGFIGADFPFFDQRAVEDDDIPRRWVRFWKLHGSINWRHQKVRHSVVRGSSTEDGEEQMIHPSHLKYDASRRMPYLVMIDRLRSFLRDADGPVAIFLLGYSFSDQHLNEVLFDGLRANPNAACFAIQYGKIAQYSAATEAARLISNMVIIAEDAGIMRGQFGIWQARKSADVSAIRAAFTTGGAAAAPGEAPSQDNEDVLESYSCKLGDFATFARLLDEFTPANDG
jgi:SIR2-like domain